MQRALSLTKHVNSVQLDQMREGEIERLLDLLPHGLQTHLNVDIYSLMSQTPGREWCFSVPPTLISDPSGFTLISPGRPGSSQAQKYSEESEAFRTFISETRKQWPVFDSHFPRFVHRVLGRQPSFHADFASAEVAWRSYDAMDQRLQQYVSPGSTQVSVLRAHWKQARKRAVYYIVSNRKTHRRSRSEIHRFESKLPFLIKRLPELNVSTGNQETENRRKFVVSIKSAAECWAVKRLKQIPEVNRTLLEVVKLLETCFLAQKQEVQQLVCDFLPDQKQGWVLLACKGCYFHTSAKAITQNFEQKHKIDLRFILFPLFSQKQILGQRIREAKKTEDQTLTSYARRISVLGLSDLKRQQMEDRQKSPEPAVAESQASSIQTMAKKGIQDTKNSSFNRVVSNYDEMMGNIKRYKTELKGATNFLEKYGGLSFWMPILRQFEAAFRASPVLKRYFDLLNFEECAMMSRGYLRILEGNYNMYYKRSLLRAHKGLGIDSEVYHTFVTEVEQVLASVVISSQDCGIIIRRFRMLEGAMCVIGDEGNVR